MNFLADTVLWRTEIIFTFCVFVVLLLVLLFYINESKKRRLKLDSRHDRFIKLFENSNDAIIITNQSGHILNANNTAKQKFDIKEKQNNQSLFSLFPKESQRKIFDRLEIKDTYVQELRLNALSGDKSIMSVSLSIAQWEEEEIPYFGYIIEDVTAVLQSEKEQKVINSIYKYSNSEVSQDEFLKKVIHSICSEYGFEFGELWVNNESAIKLITNDSLDNNKTEIKIVHHDDIESELLNKLLFQDSTYKVRNFNAIDESTYPRIGLFQNQGYKHVVTMPVVFNHKISVAFFLYSKANYINVELFDSLFLAVNIIGEINERKIIANELEEKHLLLDEAEKISDAGNWEWNFFNDTLYFSKGFLKIYGREEKKYSDTLEHEEDIFFQIHGDDADKVKLAIDTAIAEKRNYFVEYRITVKGFIRHIIMRGIPKLNHKQKVYAFFGVIHDITSLKREQAKKQKIERINFTGRMSQVLAHEIRNPLSNINLSTNFLKEEIEEEELVEYIDLVQNNSNRINEIVTSFLNQTRKYIIALNQESVHSIIKKSIELCSDRFTLSGVKLEQNLGEDSKIMADNKKLPLVFSNIILNGIDAQSETENSVISIGTERVGNKIVISISDNGIGMNQATIDNLFEPFFTNKEKGLGIGMAAVENIITHHDADIEIDSKLGEGTTFKFIFELA